MKNKDLFFSISCKKNISIQDRLYELESQYKALLTTHHLNSCELVFSRIFFSDIKNQYDIIKKSALYLNFLSKSCVSYIEQPPLNGAKIVVLLWFCKGSINKVKDTNANLSWVKMHGHNHLFHSVRYTEEEAQKLSAEEQTMEAFAQHKKVLEKEKMTLEKHCQRTWLFVRDVDYNYADVVTGRNKVFEKEALTRDSHYIASTGIGGHGFNNHSILCADFYSVEGIKPNQIHYLHATDYLNPTYEYGVAFERGTALSFEDATYLFISGTASIDKYGACLYKGDVLKQTQRLFLNISKLLEDGSASLDDIKVLIVYLRDISDYDLVKSYIDEHFPQLPKIITEARVCRPEWLIEVECIAVK